MKAGLTGSFKDTARDTEKAAGAMDKMERSTKKVSDRIREQKAALDAWRKSLPPPNVTIYGEGGGNRSTSPSTPVSIPRGGYGLATKPPGASSNSPPITPPPIMPPPIPGGAGAGGGGGWRGILATASQIGNVITGVAASFYLIRRAVNIVLEPLRMFARNVMNAAEAARSLYAKTLASGGLPIGFTAHRSSLSAVIGIGEDQVYQYASAVSYLNSQLRHSTTIISETTRINTATAWSFKAMGLSFTAIWAKIAVAMAPALQELANLIRHMNEFVVDTFAFNYVIVSVGRTFWGLSKILEAVAIASEGFTVAMQGLVDLFTGSPANIFGKTKNLFSQWMEHTKSFFTGGVKEAPAPTVSTQRLPGSPWERMGLVIGNAGGVNYSQQIAHNTRRSNLLLERIASNFMPRSGGAGFSPNTAMP